MPRRLTRVYITIGLIGIAIIFTKKLYLGTLSRTERGERQADVSTSMRSTVDYYTIQSSRQTLLSERCPRYQNLTQNIMYKRYRPQLSYLPEYNMTVCNVDKAGGTFMKTFMSILRNPVLHSTISDNPSRLDIHMSAVNFTVFFNNPSWRTSKIITASRNPYTRLYSAYVDKIMTPSVSGPIRPGDKCFFDVSFEEFLKLVVYNNDHGIVDSHWTPIYYQCRPCEYKQAVILKQETFGDDLQYILDTFNIDTEARIAVHRLMGQDRIKWTIKTTVKEIMKDALRLKFNNETLVCIGWIGILQRLWTSFQIQGYINKTVPLHFKHYTKQNSYKHMTVFLETVFEAIEMFPMTPSRAKAQRRGFMTDAYKSVSRDVIEGIKRVFAADFHLFNYSLDIPI